jgi:hypothetical protein
VSLRGDVMRVRDPCDCGRVPMIPAVIYYTCTCQSIGTEEKLKRKEMKL